METFNIKNKMIEIINKKNNIEEQKNELYKKQLELYDEIKECDKEMDQIFQYLQDNDYEKYKNIYTPQTNEAIIRFEMNGKLVEILRSVSYSIDNPKRIKVETKDIFY